MEKDEIKRLSNELDMVKHLQLYYGEAKLDDIKEWIIKTSYEKYGIILT